MMSARITAARSFAWNLRMHLRRLGLARLVEGCVHAKPDDVDAVAFRCNLCGTPNRVARSALDRDRPSCMACGSSVRFRAIAWLVVRELIGWDCALPELPPSKQWRGLGLSDATAYALPFARKFDYLNTYLHKEPRLDIANADLARYGNRDFVVASDVFEHVAPPVERAFANARALLRNGGKLFLTAPFTFDAETVEHFPELHDWSVEKKAGRWQLRNRTVDGRETIHEKLVFHGGEGTTLEMRNFSQAGLVRELKRAGFSRVQFATEPYPPFGILWSDPWSVPMVASC